MTRVPWLVAQAPPITRDGARDAARRELSERIYREAAPDPVEQFLQWALDRLGDLLARASAVLPGGVPSLLVVLAVVAVLVLALRLGLGPARRDVLADRRPGARQRTAADYRAEAERLAAAGEHPEALRARFRALARELEERGVLDPWPGRTAGEIAWEAGRAVPHVRVPLHEAATLFDAVWYGGRPAGAEEYARMRAADEQVRGERLATTAAAP